MAQILRFGIIEKFMNLHETLSDDWLSLVLADNSVTEKVSSFTLFMLNSRTFWLCHVINLLRIATSDYDGQRKKRKKKKKG